MGSNWGDGKQYFLQMEMTITWEGGSTLISNNTDLKTKLFNCVFEGKQYLDPKPRECQSYGSEKSRGAVFSQSPEGQTSKCSNAEHLRNSCIPFCSFADCQKQTPRVSWDGKNSTPGLIDKSRESTKNVSLTSLHFSHTVQKTTPSQPHMKGTKP